ncbi:MAG: Riboflavin biosynthesis protein RibD [Phycisphaerae bacterium]|nr:Riboflavin biosynthesis protein RibD [Phycisphaerae bacterium]
MSDATDADGRRPFSDEDRRWMAGAIDAAQRGIGAVEPNPMVGAAVVAGGRCVGQGIHERFGGPHAEVNALRAAGPAARGATLYVSLEPCCHRGKTGPCTEAIVAAGVARVVCAMIDPFDRVAGRGVETLRAAGVACDVGCLETEARDLNEAYLTLIERGRPLVIAKWAQTADGLIAAPSLARWITGQAARDEAHRLRAICQAILVGVGTVLADDPELTTRHVEGPSPHRYVLDGRLCTPTDCRLVRTVDLAPITVVTGPLDGQDRIARAAALRAAGVEVLSLGDGPRVAWADLLAELGRRRVTRLLVEGGADVLRSLIAARAADRAAIFASPDVGGQGVALWPEGRPFDVADAEVTQVGRDKLTAGRLVYH